jgi:hypothetical protein
MYRKALRSVNKQTLLKTWRPVVEEWTLLTKTVGLCASKCPAYHFPITSQTYEICRLQENGLFLNINFLWHLLAPRKLSGSRIPIDVHDRWQDLGYMTFCRAWVWFHNLIRSQNLSSSTWRVSHTSPNNVTEGYGRFWDNFCRILTMVCQYWRNCASGLHPSSGVSRTNKIEELEIIDKRSQYTRPQTNHTRINSFPFLSSSSSSSSSSTLVWFFCGRVYCDLLSIISNSSILFVLETPDDG